MSQSNQTTSHKPHFFAEIIESSLQTFTGQSWEWDYFPAFGSLVTVQTQKRKILGIVYSIKTGSSDPHRSPFTYKKTEAELRAEQPHIFEFMQTDFCCLTVGFIENDSLFYQISPEPPKMHAFISHSTPEDIVHFFKSSAYLHLIFNTSLTIPVDELLLSLLQTIAHYKLLSQSSCITFIETIQLITGDDYRRLKILLNRSKQAFTPT